MPAAGAEQVVLARFERGDVLQGESLTEVRSRWRRFRATFAVDEPTLLVTHDAVVRVALLDIAQRPLVDEGVSDHLAGLRATIESQAL